MRKAKKKGSSQFDRMVEKFEKQFAKKVEREINRSKRLLKVG